MKISELLDDIRNSDLVLPEFQREYVWNRDQAKQLMVSLMRGYPVGGLLFWKTDQPPELKNIRVTHEKIGTIKVILDGQQRLTTLYLLIDGEIPPYYTEADIAEDPRNLYFNIENGELQYYQPSRMQDSPLWHNVVECFRLENTPNDINVFKIAESQTVLTEKPSFELAQLYNRNLSKLRGIRILPLPEQTVPSHASITDAIDIFDRVNSQGTKLSDAELALTHITGKWSHARRIMKVKIDDLEKRAFFFDLTFMTRSLTGIVTRRALFDSIHDVPEVNLLAGWSQLSKILDYLVTLLPQKAFVHSSVDLNTANVLVPLIVYLSQNEGHFPNQLEMKRALYWLYAAHIWARYSSQTDQRLELDLSLVVRNPHPWDELCNQIIDQRGRIKVQPSDLEGRGIQQSLYRMSYILN